MATVQADASMVGVNATVQMTMAPTFQAVPQDPASLAVPLSFLRFRALGHNDIVINNPVDTTLYRLEMEGANIVVEEVQIA